MSVESKRQELQAIRDQISQIDPSSSAYATLKAQEEALEAEISDLKTAAQQTAIEEKVQGEAVHIAIEGVEFEKLPTSLVTVIDKVVKADRKTHFTQHAIEIEQIENAAEERELQMRRQNEELQRELRAKDEMIEQGKAANESLIHENGNLRDRTAELLRENGDLSSKLTNASEQIAEKDEEIKRLKSQIDDYQKAKVFGEREAQNVITADASVADDINQAIKYFLTAEDWGSVLKANKPDGSFELVKRSEFESEWQPIAPPALPGGSNDGATFLGSDQADDSDTQGDSALPAMEVTFQTEDAAAGLDKNAAVRESDAEALTLEQRVARLEAHVFANKVGEAA